MPLSLPSPHRALAWESVRFNSTRAGIAGAASAGKRDGTRAAKRIVCCGFPLFAASPRAGGMEKSLGEGQGMLRRDRQRKILAFL